ncbi:ATP-binding protein [Kitasatospora sp. NPDC059973]|uniref:ATP-binding protein n=1 Tax=Kitasatospora sp. NPDC059973 TaxID=3347020 RepID=UPI00369FF337
MRWSIPMSERAFDRDQIAHFTPEYHPKAPGDMRRQTIAALSEHGVGLDAGAELAIELTVTELVTNGMRYGGIVGRLDVFLYLETGGFLTVEVWDGEGAVEPVIKQAADDDDSGRGLALVAGLAERLWWERASFAKKVCARISLRTPAESALDPRRDPQPAAV